jgi:hypothetical protein
MKIFFQASKLATILSLFLLAACDPSGLNVKVYYLDPARGLVRSQANEVIPFDQAAGYRCMNKADFDAVVEYVRSCMDRPNQ